MRKGIRISLIVLVVIILLVSITGHYRFFGDSFSNWITDNFALIAGASSIIGLIGLLTPRKIRSTDFENEELEKLKSLLQTTEELSEIEKNRNETEQELQQLAQKKAVMELSIKRAGLVLFYRDKLKKSSEIIQKRISDDNELRIALAEAKKSNANLKALSEEIETDENFDLIDELLRNQNYIIGEQREKKPETGSLFLKILSEMAKLIPSIT